MEKKIEFVSYDGQYPNLCFGTLVYRVDGVEYSDRVSLSSGGSVGFTDDWDPVVEYGEWKDVTIWNNFKRPSGIKNEQEYKVLLTLINENVMYGCCGGCV